MPMSTSQAGCSAGKVCPIYTSAIWQLKGLFPVQSVLKGKYQLKTSIEENKKTLSSEKTAKEY